MPKLHLNKDLLAGLMFMAWGIAGLWFGRNYAIGTTLRMGPGYMPFLLCAGLVLLGGAIAIKGALSEGERLTRWPFWPLVVITASVVAFAVLIEPAGLIVATVVIVVLGASCGPDFRLIEALVLAAGLAAGAIALFVYGLKLPMAIWPQELWADLAATIRSLVH